MLPWQPIMPGGALAFTVTFSASENNPNMVSKFTAAGWNGTSPFIGTIVINAGVIIGSTSASTPALDLTSASFPTGTIWIITNNGRIQGKGGAGGAGGNQYNGNAGSAGGTALKINKAATITNNEMWGGGGGGGGGGGNNYNDGVLHATTGGTGGGGAGTQAGSGGSGASASAGGTGSSGTTDSPCVGGTGGNGGGPGLAGSSGASGNAYGGFSGAGGGAAGKYIDGSAYATWATTGDRRGNTA